MQLLLKYFDDSGLTFVNCFIVDFVSDMILRY